MNLDCNILVKSTSNKIWKWECKNGVKVYSVHPKDVLPDIIHWCFWDRELKEMLKLIYHNNNYDF